MAEEYIIAGQSFKNHTEEDTAAAKQQAPGETPPAGDQTQRRHADGLPIIVDSGLSTNILPPTLIKALYGAFATPPQLVELHEGGPFLFAAPCDAEAPTFGIKIGGHVFEQAPRSLLIASANVTVNGTALCALGSQPGIERAGALGVTFLSGVVAVFDVGASEMRFAERDGDGLGAAGSGTTTGGSHPHGNGTTAGNGSSTGGNSTGTTAIPPASSGLANTNAGGRLVPMWAQVLKQVACGLFLGQM